MCNCVGISKLNFQTHHATSHTHGFTLGVAKTYVDLPLYLLHLADSSAHLQDLAQMSAPPRSLHTILQSWSLPPSVLKALYTALWHTIINDWFMWPYLLLSWDSPLSMNSVSLFPISPKYLHRAKHRAGTACGMASICPQCAHSLSG